MVDRRYQRQCSLSPGDQCQVSSSVSGPLTLGTECQVSSGGPMSTSDQCEVNHDVLDNEEFYATETEKPLAVLDNSINNNEHDNDDSFYDKLENKIDSFTAAPSLITSH